MVKRTVEKALVTNCSGRDDIYLQLLDILKLANKHELKVIYMFIISLLKIGR